MNAYYQDDFFFFVKFFHAKSCVHFWVLLKLELPQVNELITTLLMQLRCDNELKGEGENL